MSTPKIKLNGSWVPLVTIPTTISSFTNDAGYVVSDTTANFTVSDTAPSNPSVGDVWIDMSSDEIPMANGVDF